MNKKILNIILFILLSSIAYSQQTFRNNGAIITTSGNIFIKVEDIRVINSTSTGVTTEKGEFILKDDTQFIINNDFESDLDCFVKTYNNSYLYVLNNLTNKGPFDIFDNSILAVINNLINEGQITNNSQIEIGQ